MSNTNSNFETRYFGDTNPNIDKVDLVKRLSKYRKKHLVKFLQSIPQAGTLLDLGCGKGKSIYLLKQIRPDINIIATDITDMSSYLPPDIEFHQVSVDQILSVCSESSVDAIISEHVIEHIVYPNTMFENSLKVLKMGGQIYIETPNWTRLFMPFSPLYFWNDYTHIHPYSPMALRRAFMDYGYQELYVQSVSSIEFGKRFLHTRIENGVVKTGIPAVSNIYKPQDSIARKLFNAVLDLVFHPFSRDILIGVAKKTQYVK
jgi:ubiquinone/menaquinone biosynthesis C-methylase UbiE